ncbi:MAG: hypothetical protein NXY57DRAFT_966863 [Lentinula lateritia]|nr:MAG: hypothetical protein NXY57DRAFT_966863 [Lentinula lateritia]
MTYKIFPSDLAYPLPLPVLTGAELAAHAWDEEEICLHSVSPLQRMELPYVGIIFDIRLRRWYRVIAHHEYPPSYHDDPDSIFDDPYWLSVLQSSGHRGRDDFNEIRVNDIDGSLTYCLNPIHSSGIPIYGLQPPPLASYIPSIPSHDLKQRQYLFRSTETCSVPSRGWQGVVFKQILQGRGEVTRFNREITLLHLLRESEYFLPLLACVVDTTDRMRGFLVPFGGTPLDKLPTVRWKMFLNVLQGLIAIHSIPAHALETLKTAEDLELVEHGDICARNVLVDESGKLYLIDVGSRTEDYPGDRRALIDMMIDLRAKAGKGEDEVLMEKMLKLLGGSLTLPDIAKVLHTARPSDINGILRLDEAADGIS